MPHKNRNKKKFKQNKSDAKMRSVCKNPRTVTIYDVSKFACCLIKNRAITMGSTVQSVTFYYCHNNIQQIDGQQWEREGEGTDLKSTTNTH